MLVLSGRIGEAIVSDEQIRVVVADVKDDGVRLGICAPATVRVDRQEVHECRSLLLAPNGQVSSKSPPAMTARTLIECAGRQTRRTGAEQKRGNSFATLRQAVGPRRLQVRHADNRLK